MLITFRTKSYANITMFGDVAHELLRMMGHSGRTPGALSPADVPDALSRLQNNLANFDDLSPTSNNDNGDDESADEPPVSLKERALPLVELLAAAKGSADFVMWDGH